MSSTFKHYCDNEVYIGESYAFATVGVKMKPEEIYRNYVMPGSEKQLNIDNSEVQKWEACEQTGNWKPAAQLRKELLAKAVEMLNTRFPQFLKHKTYSKFLAADMGKGTDSMEKQIETVRNTATQYAREVQAYGKRWKDLEPDFCTPLNVALNGILEKVEEIENG